MSATLTWFTVGPQTKTGTTIPLALTDLKSLIDAQSANADFHWEVASSNLGSTPYYLVLKRKDASAGRILIVHWSSFPAGNNTAILDGSPTTTSMFMCWFPNGNVDTPSNLTASSGTIMGNDTNCVKCNSIGSPYGASYQWSLASCTEALVLYLNNNTASTIAQFFFAVGDILVDAADNAYGGVLGGTNGGTSLIYTLYNVSGASQSWSSGTQAAGSEGANPYVRSNYGVANTCFGPAFNNNFNMGQVNFAAADIWTSSATQEVFFAAIPLAAWAGSVKGTKIKLRQMAIGPYALGMWPIWNSTGPVVQARAMVPTNLNQQAIWLTNFKL